MNEQRARRQGVAIGVRIVVMALVGAGLGLLWVNRGGGTSGPIAGVLEHDFGDVDVPADGTPFEHRFELTNVTDRVLTIATLRSGCGCTSALPSTMEIAPGADFVVDTVLQLTRAGEKTTDVTLVYDDETPPTGLTLRAVGHRASGLFGQPDEMFVPREGTIPARYIYEVMDDEATPADPEINAPASIGIDAWRWEAIDAVEHPGFTVHRWHLVIQIAWDGGDLGDGTMTVGVPGAGSRSTQLNLPRDRTDPDGSS